MVFPEDENKRSGAAEVAGIDNTLSDECRVLARGTHAAGSGNVAGKGNVDYICAVVRATS